MPARVRTDCYAHLWVSRGPRQRSPALAAEGPSNAPPPAGRSSAMGGAAKGCSGVVWIGRQPTCVPERARPRTALSGPKGPSGLPVAAPKAREHHAERARLAEQLHEQHESFRPCHVDSDVVQLPLSRTWQWANPSRDRPPAGSGLAANQIKATPSLKWTSPPLSDSFMGS